MDPAKPLGASPGSDSAQRPATEIGGVSPEAVERLERLVADVVESVVAAEPNGPAEQRLLEAIEHLGQREFVTTAAISARVLDRRFQSMDSHFAARGPMARRLAELRKMADDLDPSRIKLGGRRGPADEIKELDRYFERFSKTEPRLEAILAELGQSRFALDRDSASVDGEEASLSKQMETLREHAFLAQRLDGALSARLDRIALERPDHAARVRERALTALRRRRQEILTQLAIATQGYAALQMVRESNDGVMLAIDSAISTTAAALRTAVLAAQAAASQRLALEHVEAARMARGAIESRAQAIKAGAAIRTGETEALRAAWAEMRAALDEVDARKAAALRSISSADRELTRPKG